MRTQKKPHWLPALIVALFLALLWWFVTSFGIVNTHFLPSPQSSFARLFSGWDYY